MTLGFRRFDTLAAYLLGGYVWLIQAKLALFEDLAPRITSALSNRRPGVTPICGDPECDLSQFWPAGFAARVHHFALLYDPPAFLSLRQELVPGSNYVPFVYPPTALLPSVLISFLPFDIAFLVWSFGFLLMAVLALRWAKLSWLVILGGVLSPASMLSIQLGQFGTLTGAILVAGLMGAQASPCKAGALLSTLLVKPQMALLVPVVLLARRNVPAISAGVLGGAVIILATLLSFGLVAWHVYLTEGAEQVKILLQTPPFPHSWESNGVSVFWMLRSLGATLTIAYSGQILGAALAVLGAVVTCNTKRFSLNQRVALTVILSLFMTPYGFAYDMVGFSIALVAIAAQRGWQISSLDMALWLYPGLCRFITLKTGILFTPIILILAAIRITWP